ncbi:MAG: glutamate ligase domain-containing protein, partial [Bacillota bacterium]
IDIADRRRLAVLGEMLELGDRARTAHLEVGDYLAAKGVDIIITFGHWGRLIARGAVRSGVSLSSVYHVSSKRQAIDLLQQLIENGDTLLVKGSRGNQMEEIVQALIQEEK